MLSDRNITAFTAYNHRLPYYTRFYEKTCHHDNAILFIFLLLLEFYDYNVHRLNLYLSDMLLALGLFGVD